MTLAHELPRQQRRCRQILENALAIGAPGVFLVAFLHEALARAEEAAASNDLALMVSCCIELQSFKE